MGVKWWQCRDCWRPFKQLARLARHKARLTFFLDRVLTMISFVFFLLATCFSIWGDAQRHMICKWYDTFFRRYIRELVVELGGVAFWLFEVKSAKAFWTDQIWFRIKRDLADIMSLLGVYEWILVHSCNRVVCIESNPSFAFRSITSHWARFVALFGIQYFMFITNFKRPISWEFKGIPQWTLPRKRGLLNDNVPNLRQMHADAKGSSASCLFSCIGLLLGLSPAALLAHLSDIQGVCPQGANDGTTPSDAGIMDTQAH